MASSQIGASKTGRRAAGKKTGLSLSNDLVFKLLFSTHLPLLTDLINAVRHTMEPITVTRVMNPTILPAELTSKEVVLDILAEDSAGRRLGIEMQLQRFQHWPQRSVYGVARSLAGQVRAGQDYRLLKPTIGISLLVHDLFKAHPNKAAWHFTLRDTEQPQVQLGEDLQVHIMELRKAEQRHELPTPLRAWIACLLHNLDEAAMSQINYPPVKEALKHLDAMYADEELRLIAERREQALVDAEDMVDYALIEGERKGLVKGLTRGRQEGAADMLSTLLVHKFGALPDWARTRLEQADQPDLNRWTVRILDAQCLEDVFI